MLNKLWRHVVRCDLMPARSNTLSLFFAVFRRTQRSPLVAIFWHMPQRHVFHCEKEEENCELQKFMTGIHAFANTLRTRARWWLMIWVYVLVPKVWVYFLVLASLLMLFIIKKLLSQLIWGQSPIPLLSVSADGYIDNYMTIVKWSLCSMCTRCRSRAFSQKPKRKLYQL